MNGTLKTAVEWILEGIAVIPIWERQKTPALRSWAEFQNRLPTPDELSRWFIYPRNLAVITGWKGLTVLDFDNLDTFSLWRSVYPIDTFMVLTSRGIHVYLFVDNPPQSTKIPGIDIQAAGRYVLTPPSIHPSGAAYIGLPSKEILRINRIEDVIPEGLLTQQPSEGAQYKRVEIKPPDLDPWDIISKPTAGLTLAETIKQRVSILTFFPDAKSKDGRWYTTHCPFHEDQNPSFWIDSKRGLCGCYAGCTSRSLDVINLTGRLMNLSNSEAIEYLRTWL